MPKDPDILDQGTNPRFGEATKESAQGSTAGLDQPGAEGIGERKPKTSAELLEGRRTDELGTHGGAQHAKGIPRHENAKPDPLGRAREDNEAPVHAREPGGNPRGPNDPSARDRGK